MNDSYIALAGFCVSLAAFLVAYKDSPSFKKNQNRDINFKKITFPDIQPKKGFFRDIYGTWKTFRQVYPLVRDFNPDARMVKVASLFIAVLTAVASLPLPLKKI